MNTRSIKDQLQQEGFLLGMSVGVSMRPMLTQRTEHLLIEKLTQEPQVNDVVLFVRTNGQYVLHRVIRKEKKHYLIRGDNCYGLETVYPEQIIGILKGFYRDEKYIDCKVNKPYLCYVSIWRLLYPVRLVLHKLRCYIRAVISKFRR